MKKLDVVILLVALAITVLPVFPQTLVIVNGKQAVPPGLSSTFQLKAKKGVIPSVLTTAVTFACVAPDCKVDPADGVPIIVPGKSIPYTVTATLTPPGPILGGSMMILNSADPSQITVPNIVAFPACAMTPCSVTFPVSATP